MDWDLRGFGLILQVCVQVVMSFRWPCRILAAIAGFLWLVHTAVSSAKSLVFVRGASVTGKSLQYTMQRRGGKDGTLRNPCLKNDWAGLDVLDFDAAGHLKGSVFLMGRDRK
jgi:hypothetical protein